MCCRSNVSLGDIIFGTLIHCHKLLSVYNNVIINKQEINKKQQIRKHHTFQRFLQPIGKFLVVNKRPEAVHLLVSNVLKMTSTVDQFFCYTVQIL